MMCSTDVDFGGRHVSVVVAWVLCIMRVFLANYLIKGLLSNKHSSISCFYK